MSKDQRKARALAALMDSATFTEAAEKAGITRKTLYSYIRGDAEFAKAYMDAQDQIALEQLESIEERRHRAEETIFEIMEDKTQPGAVRLKAAQSLLGAIAGAQERAEKIANQSITARRPSFDGWEQEDYLHGITRIYAEGKE